MTHLIRANPALQDRAGRSSTQATLRRLDHTATIAFADGPATQWLLSVADQLKQEARDER